MTTAGWVNWNGVRAFYSAREISDMHELRSFRCLPRSELEIIHLVKALFNATLVTDES